jgi:peptidoglycan-associated lipoprotein
MSWIIIWNNLPFLYGSYPEQPEIILVFFHGKSMKAANNIKLLGFGGGGIYMKKWGAVYGLVVVLILSFVSTGCAPKKAAEQTTEVTKPQEAPGTAPAATPGQAPSVSAPSAPEASQAGFDKKIYFDFDQYELKPESTQTLAELVNYLKDNPVLKVQICGNCDERGTNEYNIALGDKRAKAAMEFCITQGIDPQRIATLSYGEEKPVDPGHSEEAWAKNRRDEFVFSK